MKNPFSLSGKLIIVTGASSGIGRQCAILCSLLDASVVLFGRNRERLDETLTLMSDEREHISFAVDLRDYVKVSQVVKEIVSVRGRVDGLVNCAGISTTLPINAVSVQRMEEYFHTNVFSAVNLSKEVINYKHFSEKGGSIIFISSVMGMAGEKGKTLYSMTKGSLISLVRSLAVEIASRGIRVNAISPGVVETPMSRGALYSQDESSLNNIKNLHPLGLGQPQDVASAAAFLLSDAARWITGTNLIVDGGYLSK